MSDRIPGSSASNPIRHRDWVIYVSEARDWPDQFFFAHDDWEPDTIDDRHGYARSVDEAKHAIDIFEEFIPALGAERTGSPSQAQTVIEQSQTKKPNPQTERGTETP